MKFELSILAGPKEKQKHIKLRGFTRLEDACAAALGLLSVYSGENDFVTVYLASGRHSLDYLAAVSVGYNDSLPKILDKARQQLAIKIAERKANKARLDWLHAKDAADKTFSARLFALVPPGDSTERIYANKAAVVAFCANDFATAEKLMGVQP